MNGTRLDFICFYETSNIIFSFLRRCKTCVQKHISLKVVEKWYTIKLLCNVLNMPRSIDYVWDWA